VDEAGDGPEALKKLSDDPTIDVLLTDLGLPGMPGAELIRRAREARPQIRIVVASGYSRDGAIDAGLPQDALFLSKPFDITQLRRVILQA